MSFPDIVPDLKAHMPELRGRLLANQPLGEFTWFRVGGPAQAFFMPEDEDDLAYFLRNMPAEIPVTVIGAGSNLIVRDGGVPGVVVRLGRGFNDVTIEDNHRVTAGSAMLDVMVARAAQKAGIAGLAFLCGIPGTIGGALRMNGGAYGGETKDVLIEARGVDRQGNLRSFSNAEMGFSYRHCGVPDDVIFTSATFQGRPAMRKRSPPRWPRSNPSARPASRAIAPAARPSRIRRAQRLETGGRGRLPRAESRPGAGLRTAQQFPDQSRRRQRRRYRNAGRNRARARQGAFRRRAGMGN